MANESEKLALLLRGAWERRWLLLGIQCLAAAITLVVFHLLPPKYRATTTIRFEPESVLNPLTQGLAVASQMEGVVGTMRQELLSRNHIESVIAHLGLEPLGGDPVENEKLIYKMASNISVSVTTPPRRSSGASLFHVAYLGDEPHRTQEVAKALATLFIGRIQVLKRSESDAAYEFINEQLEVYRRKLEESEEALRSFEEEHIDELPESRGANIARLETLRANLRDVQYRIEQALIQKDLLIKKIPQESAGSGGDDTVPNPLIDTLKQKEDELQTLKRRYSDSYPDVISLKGEIELLRREVEANPTVPASEARRSGPSNVATAVLDQLQQTDVEIESLKKRVPKLEKQIAAMERKVQGIPRSEQELVRLQRDYNVNSNIYEMFLRRLEEARVSRELEQVKKGEVLKVVEEANLPLMPFTPNRRKFFLVGLAAGLALNVALLYRVFSKDTSFRSAHEAEEYLSLSVIARMPRVDLGEGKSWLQTAYFGCALAAFAVLYVGVFYWYKVVALIGTGT